MLINVFNVNTLIELDFSFNKLKKILNVHKNLENLYLQANRIKGMVLFFYLLVIQEVKCLHKCELFLRLHRSPEMKKLIWAVFLFVYWDLHLKTNQDT